MVDLYAAGVAFDAPGGTHGGQVVVISDSPRLCYGVLNRFDFYSVVGPVGSRNPRAEIKRLPAKLAKRVMAEGHPKLVMSGGQEVKGCVDLSRLPAVIINSHG